MGCCASGGPRRRGSQHGSGRAPLCARPSGWTILALALAGATAPDWLPRAYAFKRVLLATDADTPGDTAAAKLAAGLQAYGARVARLRPTHAKDWNEALQRDPEDLRRTLRALLDSTPPSRPLRARARRRRTQGTLRSLARRW